MSERGVDAVDAAVAARVREARLRAGVSQEELGAALGVTYQQVQKYEYGVNRITASRLLRMAGVLGVDVGWFFEGVGDGIGGTYGGTS